MCECDYIGSDKVLMTDVVSEQPIGNLRVQTGSAHINWLQSVSGFHGNKEMKVAVYQPYMFHHSHVFEHCPAVRKRFIQRNESFD